MKVIQERIVDLTEKNHQSNILMPFTIDEKAEKIQIDFSYTPQVVKEETALRKIEQALEVYVPEEEMKKWGTTRRYLPLRNFITLSLMFEGKYIGAYHNKEAMQKVIISDSFSSKGFSKQAIDKGQWELQLNAHCIVSKKIQTTIRIRVEEKN